MADENTPADDTVDDADAQRMLADAAHGEADQHGEQNEDPAALLEQARKDAEKWKALARKHEGNAKANSDAAKRLTEFEESQKTEQQKLQDRLAAAEVELAQHRTAQVRTSAAREAGLSADMAEFITEVEPEAALEQAKRLAERLKPAEPARPNLMQGARQATKPQTDPNAWLRQAVGR